MYAGIRLNIPFSQAVSGHPSKQKRWNNDVLMLSQCSHRCANVSPALTALSQHWWNAGGTDSTRGFDNSVSLSREIVMMGLAQCGREIQINILVHIINVPPTNVHHKIYEHDAGEESKWDKSHLTFRWLMRLHVCMIISTFQVSD